MNTPFYFQQTYQLDRSHFTECYSETAVVDNTFRPYTKAFVLVMFAIVIMITTDISAYVSYFVFGLGIVEALGVYYRKPWWIYRQLLSKAANNDVTLTIDHQGIKTESAFVNLSFPWQDIDALNKSALGWLFTHKNINHYISDRILSDEAQQFLTEQQALISAAAIKES